MGKCPECITKDFGIVDEDNFETVEKKLQEKLGSFDIMKEHLCNYIKDHVVELSETFINIAPFGDYSKLIEDKDKIAELLMKEATKLENWKFHSGKVRDYENGYVLSLVFVSSVAEDNNLIGSVYVRPTGEILHYFCLSNE